MKAEEENISIQIENIHSYFSDYANRQVNYAYTLRNWLIGMYLFEIEQKGQNRAEYGEKLYKKIAERLKEKKIKGMSFTLLNTCRQFYLMYPQIIQTVSEKSFLIENQVLEIVQSVSEQFDLIDNSRKVKSISLENTNLFLSKISFSHILEFIKIEEDLKRSFYEI